VPEALEMTACGKPCGLPTSLGNRSCDSHISTARRLLHSLSNQLRKEALLSYGSTPNFRLILRLKKTVPLVRYGVFHFRAGADRHCSLQHGVTSGFVISPTVGSPFFVQLHFDV